MPRGPRQAFKDSFLHVFNRGLNKQTIFFDEQDYNFFLKKLGQLKDKFDHTLYAYCIMPNHFHLSIQTRTISISKIMASLSTSYSMYFNHKYHHLGPIFQNRFKSILIENSDYFIQLSRYIYLNPVKDGLTNDPADYKYSSFSEAINGKPLHFLDSNIEKLIGQTKNSLDEYKKFVYDGINNFSQLAEIDQIFEKDEQTFGSKRFRTFVSRKSYRNNLS